MVLSAPSPYHKHLTTQPHEISAALLMTLATALFLQHHPSTKQYLATAAVDLFLVVFKHLRQTKVCDLHLLQVLN